MTLVAGVNAEVSGDGPHTVVLLHGFGDNLATWRRVVPVLAVRHRVVAIDLPGHGLTNRPWTKPLVTGYVQAVMDVLEAHHVREPVSIVGNSMGAVVATMVAAAHPDRVARIALIGMPGVSGVPLLWRAAVSRPATVAFRVALAPIPQRRLQHGIGWFYARAASPHPSLIDKSALRGFSAHYGERWQLHRLSDLGRVLLGELVSMHLPLVLDRLEIPTVQIWGRRDVLVPPRRSRSDDTHIVLDDCGHCPQLDAPDALLAVLIPFLGDPEPAGARLVRRMRAPES